MLANALRQPYPFNTSLKRELLSAFLFGLFIFLFLLIFQPFGLSQYQSENKDWVMIGYGLITTAVILLNNNIARLIFPLWFSRERWTVGKNIIYTCWMFFSIGTANLFFSVYLGFLSLSLKGFLSYQAITLGVGMFPVVISTFGVYNLRLKAALKAAGQLNENIHNHEESHLQLEISSKNKSEGLTLELDQLLTIKAVENYIEVYMTENGKVNKKLIRNTLKETEYALDNFEPIQRCHRSYLVNLNQVESFSGNAQGLSLQFKANPEIQVPVSRAYVSKIKSIL